MNLVKALQAEVDSMNPAIALEAEGTDMNRACALEANDVVVVRNGQKILNHVELRLNSGDIVAMVGPNGSGKTTVLHSLAGLIAIELGEIFLKGQSLTEFEPCARARLLSIAVQVPMFPPELTVTDLVALGRTPYRVSARQKTKGNPPNQQHELVMIQSAIHDVGIEHLAQRRLDSLSGGEKRRAHVARVLAQDTPIVLLDEPTTHLDAEHTERLHDVLERRARSGAAILIATHDQGLANRRCNRVLRLCLGQLKTVEGAA